MCAEIAPVLIVIVVIVVTMMTYGALTEPVAAAGGAAAGTTGTGVTTAATATTATAVPAGTVGAGSVASTWGLGSGTAAAAAAGAAAGATGAMAGQLLGIATGLQNGIDWRQIGMGAIGGAVGAGLGGVGFGEGIQGQMLQAMAGNALTQGGAVLVGLQDRFNWRSLAAAAIAAPVARFVGKQVFGPALQGVPMEFGERLARSIVSGVVSQGVRVLVTRQGKMDYASIAADAFGNAIGESLASQSTQGQGPWSSADYRNGSDIESDNFNPASAYGYRNGSDIESDAFRPAMAYGYRNGSDVESDNIMTAREAEQRGLANNRTMLNAAERAARPEAYMSIEQLPRVVVTSQRRTVTMLADGALSGPSFADLQGPPVSDSQRLRWAITDAHNLGRKDLTREQFQAGLTDLRTAGKLYARTAQERMWVDSGAMSLFEGASRAGTVSPQEITNTGEFVRQAAGAALVDLLGNGLGVAPSMGRAAPLEFAGPSYRSTLHAIGGEAEGLRELVALRAKAGVSEDNLVVEATFEHGGKVFYDVNQTARNPELATDAKLPIYSEAKARLGAPNQTFATAHAEVGAMGQSFEEGVRGGDATLTIFGKDACTFCVSDVKRMAQQLQLDTLTVIQPSGTVKFVGPQDFAPIKLGGKKW